MRKFLCDAMCGELGRWLRIAGYDTAIALSSANDTTLFQQAVREKRLLLTRDKHFKELDPQQKTVLFLENERIDGWVEQLKSLGVDWLKAPFSRCLKCNSLLKKIQALPQKMHDKVPENTHEFWTCPTCGDFFWHGSHTERMESRLKSWQNGAVLSIGFGGDLMIGRGVDNHLNHVPLTDVWGTLLPHLKERDFNFVNLETTLTRSQKINIKVFNFKADPEKVAVLTAGKIEAVNLANNHILDFSEEGLLETIRVLDQAHILHVGAGKNSEQAKAPCIIEKKGIKVGFLGCTDNEPTWKATSKRPGTFFLNVGDLRALRSSILALRKKVDLLVLSIHWGPNMRQRPTSQFRAFAHELIDLGVDILHGHSAHIFQGVEVYKQKLILYDTGDFVDDYANDPVLRNDWSFFFVVTAVKHRVISLQMIPTQIARYQVNVSKETRILDRMEKLCKELNSYPVREGSILRLDLEKNRG